MNFSKLIDEVQKKTQTIKYTDTVKDYINDINRELSYSIFSNNFIATATISTTADVAEYNLPDDFAMLLDVYQPNKKIERITYQDVVSHAVNNITSTDNINWMLYDTIASGGVETDMVTASIVSTDAADTYRYEIIFETFAGSGAVASGYMTGIEDVLWNASAVTAGVAKIESVYIDRPLIGTATIAAGTAAAVVMTISAGLSCVDYSTQYRRLKASPTPVSETYYVMYVRQVPKLRRGLDSPLIPEWFHPSLVDGVSARIFRDIIGDIEKAEYFENRYQEAIARLNGTEARQNKNKLGMTYTYGN